MTPAFQDWVDRAKMAKIEAVLHERNIKLKGRGNQLAGACPNCGGEDRFAVHLGKQQFNCRGCGAGGGGAISLVRFLDGCDFLRAVETITGETKPDDKSQRKPSSKRKATGRIVKTYDYHDEIGNLLFQVLRYDPKGFSQRRPDPDNPDAWIPNLSSVRLVPYRLPAIIEAIALDQTIYIVEGEKDADTGVERLGIVATTTAMGAGKWKGEQGDRYAEFFRGADVVVIPDNDQDPRKGRAHATMIAGKLHNIVERVRVLSMPHGYKDLTEWTDAVGTREDLDRLTEIAPDYMNGFDPGAAEQGADPQEQPKTVAIFTVEMFIKGFIPPDYLVDSIIQRRFVYAITGQTGHAKTAIALLLAELIASRDENAMLGRYRVTKGRVVYFVGENPDDVRMRVIGSHSVRTDDPMRDDIFFVPGQFNIPEMRGYLMQEFARLGGVNLIIVDTSAAYFLGKDEIDNVEMGAHARMLRTLTEMPGSPAVIPLCHPIKRVETPEQLIPRGGGAFLNEVDGNLTLFRTSDDTVEMSYNKMRGPGFQPITFKLDEVRSTKLIDAKGREIPTVRARVMTEAQRQQQELEFTQEIDHLLATMAKYPDHSYAQWAEQLEWFHGGRRGEASQTPYKMKVQRTIEFIEKKAQPKLIRRNMDKPHLTEEGLKEALRAETRIKTRAENEAQGTMFK
jgi:hypothetical protein